MKKNAFAFCLILFTIPILYQACTSSSKSEVTAAPAPADNGGAGSPQTPASWAVFSKFSNAIFEPQFHVAGDASVIKFGGQYLLYYSCLDNSTDHLTICVATSSDGLTWVKPNTAVPVLGRVLKTDPTWATAEETAYATVIGGNVYLYFSGYTWHANVPLNYPSYMGIAASGNGLDFYYPGASPLLAPTVDGADHDAIYSPSLLKSGTTYYLIYSAYCFTSTKCKTNQPVSILGATSPDALAFTKETVPVLEANPALSWMSKSVAEPDFVQGPDGKYYLFFTGIDQNDVQKIGVAYSSQPFGPWTINPTPIIVPGTGTAFDANGVVAPHVLIENNIVKIWFSGFDANGYIRIGYASAAWPLVTP